VVDDQEIGEFDCLVAALPQFSPDSRRVAFAAGFGRKEAVVVDGKAQRKYENVAKLAFSPDGSRLAAFAEDGEAGFVVVDGVEAREKTYTFPLAGDRLVFDGANRLRTLAARVTDAGTELFEISVEITN
jgi:hypothetical protein